MANAREVDPVQQAVDDYILMERKARAWDILRATVASKMDRPIPLTIDDMERILTLSAAPASPGRPSAP